MIILGIETSCDETSLALISAEKNKPITVLAHETASQIDIHKKFGGVVPEIAGRKHAEYITPMLADILDRGYTPDAIAVAAGPGLITGLIMGVETAKTLSYTTHIPLIAVNHLEGHIYSVLTNENKKITFPALSLIVSGGHTELILMKDHVTYEKIGATRDDAAGECFDKVAKILQLEYPGGPKISKCATTGNRDAIAFPRPMMKDDTFDFSFAGLKTAVLYYVRDNPDASIDDICASFEQAIVDVLVAKTLKAIQKYSPKTLIISGGVSANTYLRDTMTQKISEFSEIQLFLPAQSYTTDNAAMIATAGFFKMLQNQFTDWKDLQANPNWTLEQASAK